MEPLLDPKSLMGSLAKVLMGTILGVKYGVEFAYGISNSSPKKTERLQKEALAEEIGKLERQARKGNPDMQFEYGVALFTYGYEYNPKTANHDMEEGLKWIKKAAENGHTQAKTFLHSLN